MLKHPNYQYGSLDCELPGNLNFSEFILNKLMEFKEKTVVNGLTNETTSFGEIAQRSMNLAVSLSELGVRKGRNVAICSENRSEFPIAVVGSICTGATLSTINLMYIKHELIHVIGISKPNYIICSPQAYKMHSNTFNSFKYIEKIIIFGNERLPNTISFNELVSAHSVKFEEFQVADADPIRDALFVLYSSGTTGLPKGVILTHLNLLITSCAKRVKLTEFDILLTVAPWFHAMGLMGMLLCLYSGWYMVFLPKFEMELYLKCIQKYKATRLVVVPPILVALAKHPVQYDLSSVKLITSGSAPVDKETLAVVARKFPNSRAVLQAYGMTETTLAIAQHTSLPEKQMDDVKQGSVGTVVLGVVLKVTDLDTRKPVGAHQPGEICVKGAIVMKGYVGKDRGEDFDEEGFFRTGDVGYYDEDGYLYIVDRLKELIKYKGYQVPPAEIEALLLQHPAVRDVGVVGVPHADAGEVPRAFVVLQPGASVRADELQRFVAERLSNPKHLRGGVRFVPDVPKNPSGKILRRQLKAMLDDKSKL